MKDFAVRADAASMIRPRLLLVLTLALALFLMPGRTLAVETPGDFDMCTNLAGIQSTIPLGLVAVTGGRAFLVNEVNVRNDRAQGRSFVLDCRLPPPGFVAPHTNADGAFADATLYDPIVSTSGAGSVGANLSLLGVGATRATSEWWYTRTHDNFLTVDGAATVTGTTGRDAIYARNSLLDANATEPTLPPMRGSVTIRGMAGDDHLSGAYGADKLLGGPGNDSLRGHSAAASNSWWDRRAGRDTLRGGAGNDELNATDFMGDDILDGGSGRDICLADIGDRVRGCEQVFITMTPPKAHPRKVRVRGIRPGTWTTIR